jgi:hypothetical protein
MSQGCGRFETLKEGLSKALLAATEGVHFQVKTLTAAVPHSTHMFNCIDATLRSEFTLVELITDFFNHLQEFQALFEGFEKAEQIALYDMYRQVGAFYKARVCSRCTTRTETPLLVT